MAAENDDSLTERSLQATVAIDEYIEYGQSTSVRTFGRLKQLTASISSEAVTIDTPAEHTRFSASIVSRSQPWVRIGEDVSNTPFKSRAINI